MNKIKFLAVALFLFAASIADAQVNAVNKVLKSYLDVKDALVADNSALAGSRAKELVSFVKAVDVSQLDVKQKTMWLTYSEKLRFDGEHISQSDKIGHQRDYFASLSKNMTALIKVAKINTTTIYSQYCPMKKEWWLSETASIKNPYYGKNMEDCGTTKETLKAN